MTLMSPPPPPLTASMPVAKAAYPSTAAESTWRNRVSTAASALLRVSISLSASRGATRVSHCLGEGGGRGHMGQPWPG